jgi:hypothetical protein
MAESGTWDSIRKHGLLSTNALLDLFEINGEERQRIAERHRPDSVVITHPKHGKAVIRDQKPMSESALLKCLDHGIAPAEWYRTLNQRVFFWLSEKRLNGLLSARAYRSKQHCVLMVDSAELVRRYGKRIKLCPINSGSTIYKPQRRGVNTFKPICDYPFQEWKAKRGIESAVVELVVDYSVPDVADFVLRAEERNGPHVIKQLFDRD